MHSALWLGSRAARKIIDLLNFSLMQMVSLILVVLVLCQEKVALVRNLQQLQ